MATVRPQLLSPPIPEQQLNLPLSIPQTSRPIQLPEVWATLTPEQQAQFLRQIASVCCRLAKLTLQEVRNEQK